jgi:hypothetical protein
VSELTRSQLQYLFMSQSAGLAANTEVLLVCLR